MTFTYETQVLLGSTLYGHAAGLELVPCEACFLGAIAQGWQVGHWQKFQRSSEAAAAAELGTIHVFLWC